jgi:hypothetical protein
MDRIQTEITRRIGAETVNGKMQIEDDDKMEHLLGTCWEIRQDGQGNSGKKELYKQWIVEGWNQMVYKGKIKFFLCLIKHHTMNAYE